MCYLFQHIYLELSSSDLTQSQCSFVVLHGIATWKRQDFFSCFIIMVTIITSFILKPPFLQMPLNHSSVRVPLCSRADRPDTAPARVHRPAEFVHTQKTPALRASGCWKGISWEPSTFWEAALFTWTWSLGVKERVKNNKLQTWSERVNLRFKRSSFFRVLFFLFSQYSS